MKEKFNGHPNSQVLESMLPGGQDKLKLSEKDR